MGVDEGTPYILRWDYIYIYNIQNIIIYYICYIVLDWGFKLAKYFYMLGKIFVFSSDIVQH